MMVSKGDCSVGTSSSSNPNNPGMAALLHKLDQEEMLLLESRRNDAPHMGHVLDRVIFPH